MSTDLRPPIHLMLAAPRGFCAGVERAIRSVELALEQHGAPVYVRHQIVHNRHVVESLRSRGAVFVQELDECPNDRPVVLSAHGVPKRVLAEASRRKLLFVDATCPLVTKVHLEAQRHHAEGRHVLLIGHANHPEVVGTMGQLPQGAVTLVESVEDVAALPARDAERLAYATQTTLSVDDTSQIVDALHRRFPGIATPHGEDICYASTNRQQAVRAIAPAVDAFLVLGAPNSSNSRQLVTVAIKAGCRRAWLVEDSDDIDWTAMADTRRVGVTAGASAPEELVQALVNAIRQRFAVTLEEVTTAAENLTFRLPKEVRKTWTYGACTPTVDAKETPAPAAGV